jgi:hypothetical protein
MLYLLPVRTGSHSSQHLSAFKIETNSSQLTSDKEKYVILFFHKSHWTNKLDV